MQEYVDQKNSEHGHFSRIVIALKALNFPQALERSFKCPRFFLYKRPFYRQISEIVLKIRTM